MRKTPAKAAGGRTLALRTILRSKGIKATRRRMDILRALSQANAPLSTVEIHARITGADIVTVYRACARLVEEGLARRVTLGDGRDRFELLGEHHHHLVCTVCEHIEELKLPEKGLEKAALNNSRNFARVKDHSLEFFGVCKSCAKA